MADDLFAAASAEEAAVVLTDATATGSPSGTRVPPATGTMPTHPGAVPGAIAAADEALDELDPEQRTVATSLSGPVCVLAGAGTGKTRALTHRIAYGVHAGVYVPQRVLAVTFTARAAGEMRTRLRGLGIGGVQARTFHAAALRQLSYFWPQTIGGGLPRLQEHKAGLVADAAARLRLSVDRAAVRDLAAEIEWAKVGMLTPQSYPQAAVAAGHEQPGGFDLAAVARLLEIYEEVKTDRGVLDFEDVLLLTAGILEEHPQVRETVRAQYRHFVVDEYQDVNALQQRLLELWLGDRRDVCVVGDPSQTIYSFTGASPQHLIRFPERFTGTTVVRLVRDYRSTPQVVDLANRLLSRAGRAGLPASARVELVAQRPPGPVPSLTAHDDDVAEAVGVAARVAELTASGVRPAQIAVLYRTNSQSAQAEQALADAGVPYLVRGGERFFARKEVRDAVLLLRGAARSGGSSGALPEETRAVLAGAGWSEHPPSGGGAVRDRWESLQALAALADELAAARPRAGLADLVAELEERAAAQHAPAVDGVTLASLHAAKGLEWDAVLIIGLSDGLVPISLAEGWEAVEEERRLLYVGITRAREHLHLSWARARTPGGRVTRSPSRFLDGLLGSPTDRPGRGKVGPARPGGRRARTPVTCRTCGASLTAPAERKVGRCASCPPTYDEELLERLRQWRSRTAGEAKVPTYVVFTDATLVAIAETLPRDRAALAGIPGVGPAKLERYGEDVLAVLTG